MSGTSKWASSVDYGDPGPPDVSRGRALMEGNPPRVKRAPTVNTRVSKGP